MRTGNSMVDRAVRRLLSEGFHTVSYNKANPGEKSILLTNSDSHEAAVIKFGGRQEPQLSRGDIADRKPDVTMPVGTYLLHWRP